MPLFMDVHTFEGGIPAADVAAAHAADLATQAGFGVEILAVGGSTPVCRAYAALIRPASPAVHLVCPIWDFTEPRAMLPGFAPRAAKTSERTVSSVRSPTTVPVPCASTRPTSAGETPACA